MFIVLKYFYSLIYFVAFSFRLQCREKMQTSADTLPCLTNFKTVHFIMRFVLYFLSRSGLSCVFFNKVDMKRDQIYYLWNSLLVCTSLLRFHD